MHRAFILRQRSKEYKLEIKNQGADAPTRGAVY